MVLFSMINQGENPCMYFFLLNVRKTLSPYLIAAYGDTFFPSIDYKDVLFLRYMQSEWVSSEVSF